MAKEIARFLHRLPSAGPHPQDHVSTVWPQSRQGYRQLFANNKESFSVYQNDARKQPFAGEKLYLFVKNTTKRENNLVLILQKDRLIVYLQHNVNF